MRQACTEQNSFGGERLELSDEGIYKGNVSSLLILTCAPLSGQSWSSIIQSVHICSDWSPEQCMM